VAAAFEQSAEDLLRASHRVVAAALGVDVGGVEERDAGLMASRKPLAPALDAV
jgi:hypothetical protein